MNATRAALAAGLALLALGYGAVRALVVPRTDTWTLVGADADGAMLWTWLSVGNTGLLDGQLTTRLLLLPAGPGFIEHRAQWGPTTLGDDGVEAGADSLRPTPEGWELRVGGEGLAARATVRGGKPGCPPTAGELAGMIEDRTDGRLLSGTAIVTRTHTEGHPEGSAIYVLGSGFAAGVDPLSSCPAWVVAGGESWTGEARDFPVEKGTALQLGAWTVGIRSMGEPVVQEGWQHALPPERWVARAFGFQEPDTEARRVVARVLGPGLDTLAPGLVLRRF